MILEDIEKRIREKMLYAPPVRARVRFDFGDDGHLFIDGTQDPPAISRDDAESDTTLICTAQVFQAILDGTQDPNMAYLMGKLKVRGSLGLAMKLNAMLED